MPREIVKVAPDEDFYVEWSSIVEAPTAFGDREGMQAHLASTDALGDGKRIDRADATGSSAIGGWGWTWEHETTIYQQQGNLPRRNLRALCARLAKDEHADCKDLLLPFDDDLSGVPEDERRSNDA